MTKIALHWRILIGLVLGVVVGVVLNVTWGASTWASLGVDHPTAFLAGDGKAVVPVLPEGVDRVEELDPEEASLKGARPYQLTEGQIAALGLSTIPANQDAGTAAKVARFVANLNDFVGRLFIRALRFIAVPLVLFSLIVGASSLNDLAKLSRIGGKTIGIYLCTTAVAATIGLVAVNVIAPGKFVSEETRTSLEVRGKTAAESQLGAVAAGRETVSSRTVWDQLVDLVPRNPVTALSETEMLQIVVTALVIGVGLTLIPREKAAPIVRFSDGMTDVVIKLVNVGMQAAPFAVFALIVKVVAQMGLDVLGALLIYSLTVIAGLLTMVFVVYPLILRAIAKVGYVRFFKGAAPAQLLAFSSSSSAATLPVTMECAEERLGVSEEVSSFALPLGATINMDGTALYQGVAAVFIAQMFGIELTIFQQATIILTATLASIGTAAVPSAGLIMLVIVLEEVELGAYIAAGIAILFGVDRLLDMCRTTCNVTGDLMVATVVASTENDLLTEEEVERARIERESRGVDEHPHEGAGDEYGVGAGSVGRPVDVADRQ